MLNRNRNERLAQIAPIAIDYERRVEYPPQVLIAQWAIESGWGARPSGRNNLFGVTFNPSRHRGYSWVRTWEELTEAGIAALPSDERARIIARTPFPLRPGVFRVELDRKFADYSSTGDSVDDKVGLITTAARYRPVWSAYLRDRNINAFLTGICAAGYATASYYPQLAQQIAVQPNVLRAIAAARAAAGQKP